MRLFIITTLLTLLIIVSIVFLTLKLSGGINWSWWLVLSPAIILTSIVAIFGLFLWLVSVFLVVQ
jgi:hypothetical protein